MKSFLLKISSPDGNVFEDQVVSVSLRGTEGDFAVLAGHTPFVTGIKPCDIHIDVDGEKSLVGHADGGLLTVGKENTTLLSSTFKWVKD